MGSLKSLGIMFAAGSVLSVSCGVCQALEPFYQGLGTYKRHITTSSPLAQRYFNQGLAFLHGFNHGAAIRSFREAEQIDPQCALAHWAIAVASGPHINFPMVPLPAVALAWKELKLATECATNSSAVEKDLIAALGVRYAKPQMEDRAGLDLADANEMRKVWAAHPTDPDVGAFFAEAMLDLRPWDQWTLDGKPQPGTDDKGKGLEVDRWDGLHFQEARHITVSLLRVTRHGAEDNKRDPRVSRFLFCTEECPPLEEVFDLQLQADLVTLSACNTGRGSIRTGEGMVGLSWAFFVAGVPTQVVSQWSVDDTATAQLMRSFYTHLKAGEGKSQSLRAAALSLQKEKGHRHPYYWAPFLHMGDWRR